MSLSNYPPLALILIGSTLEKAGYEVEIFSAADSQNYLEVIKDKIANQDLLFVGLTVLTTEVSDAIKISKAIKQEADIPIAWGGWHVTLFPEQCAQSPFIDYAVIDEGDFSVVGLANSLARGQALESKIIKTSGHLDMNELPLPDYSLVDNIDNFITRPLGDKFQEIIGRPIRWLPYQSSRGCPSKCAFCINIVTGNQDYRAKSPAKISGELEALAKKYNIEHFKILDDNFFASKNRVKEFCDIVLRRNLEFTWDGECRVDYFRDDYLNDELLSRLKDTGLLQLVLGAESGSTKTLSYLCKNIVPQQTERAITSLQKHGIIADCSFMVGLPGETKEEVMKTHAFINKQRKHKLFLCGVQTYRPYPGSRIAQQLIAEGKLKEPEALEEWQVENIVGLYTYVDVKRPWIENYKLAMNISYYQSLASGVWLLQHQIDNGFFRLINAFFKKIGALRSRFSFFFFPIDKKIYSVFRLKMYRRLESKKES